MRRIFILAICLLFSIMTMGQKDITVGMTGKQVRDALNANFDSAYKKITSVSVKNFGAVGDGITEDRDAILAAINAVKNTDKELIIPEGTYKMNGEIQISGLTKGVKIRGMGNATLDWSGYPPPILNSDYFMFIGDTVFVGHLSADVAEGSRYITIESPDVVVNDYIMLMSDSIWGSSVYKGEICKVKEVIGNTIELYYPLSDSYDNESTVAVKSVSGSESYIQNLRFKAPTYFHPDSNRVRFVRFSFLNDLSVDNVIIENATYCNLQIDYGMNITINNYRSTRSLRSGFGYGVGLNSCQNVNVQNSIITGCRHAITTGHIYFPLRNMIVTNCQLGNARGWSYAMDTHPGCEHLILSNNIFYGGVEMRSPNFIIRNNIMSLDDSTVAQAILYSSSLHSPINGDYSIIEDNVIKKIGVNKAGTGISINFNGNNDTLNRLNINNNIVENFINGIMIFSNPGLTGSYIDQITLRNNNTNSSSAGYPLYLGGETNNLNFGNIEISGGRYNNPTATYSVVFKSGDTKLLRIQNAILEANAGPLYIYNSSVDDLEVDGNRFIANTYSATVAAIIMSSTNRATISDNKFNINIGRWINASSTVDSLWAYNNNYRSTASTVNSAGYSFFGSRTQKSDVLINNILKMTPIATFPLTPEEGMLYVDTDHHIYYYNGTAWKQLDN